MSSLSREEIREQYAQAIHLDSVRPELLTTLNDRTPLTGSGTNHAAVPPLSAIPLQVVDTAKRDIISYLNEYFPFSDGPVAAQLSLLDNLVKENDVLLLGKVGCGFCRRAKEALAAQQLTSSFVLKVHDVVGDPATASDASSMRAAMSRRLGLFDLTFPQVVVKGIYVGGADDLLDLIESGAFKSLLAGNHDIDNGKATLKWLPELALRAGRPKLLVVPRMRGSDGAWYPQWPVYVFQWVMYANLVRYVSIMHLSIMVLLLGLLQSGPSSTLTNVLLTVYVYDLLAFVVVGPSPFSISGVLSLYFGWRVRGNATSSLPYKVVFGAYLLSLIPQLVRLTGSPPGFDTSSYDKTLRASLLGFITNSALLAVFRF